MALEKLTWFFFAYMVISAVEAVVHPDGVSKVSHYQDDSGNFEFGYTVSSNDGEHFHKASKDVLGRVIGSYGLTQLDGRHRIVDYVADENGFRANIRSNEPGLADSKSPSLIVDKSGDSILAYGLDFAATGESNANYGDRLREISSSVTYARPGEDEIHRSARRPLFSDADRSSQTHRVSIARPVVIENQPKAPPVIQDRRPPLINSDSPPLVRYQPPIDPYSAIRRPAAIPPSQPVGRYPLDSQLPQPSTPPYGGFETRNPLLDPASFGSYPQVSRNFPRNIPTRFPVVTMSSIHGGLGGMPLLLNPLSPRIPNVIPSNYPNPNFRQYPVPQTRDRAFLDPSRRPNLVLRAIAIPNGIQAVHVDPTTGEIYNTPEQVIPVPYSNDFDDDDDDENNEDTDNFRFVNNRFLRSHFPVNRALPNRSPAFPRINSQRNYSSSASSYSHRDNNIPNEASLSRPSAKDLYFISRVFDDVNENRNVRHPRLGSSSRNFPPLHETRPDYPREVTYHSNADRPEFNGENNRDEFRTRLNSRSRFPQTDEQPYESSKSVLVLSDPEKTEESTS